MRNRWSDSEAQEQLDRPAREWGEAMALRVYTSRLIGRETVIDLVRSSAIKCFTWAVPVVPRCKERHLPAEAIAAVRNHQASRALALDRSHEALDNSDASVLANRTVSLMDSTATAPPSPPASAPSMANSTAAQQSRNGTKQGSLP